MTRDPLGLMMVGPPDALEQHGHFSEHMFREFATFLVEKYDAVVIDGGRAVSDELVLAAGQVSAAIFLVIDAGVPRPSATRSATSASSCAWASSRTRSAWW